MQCPNCGKTTAGTLDRCAHCDAPLSHAFAQQPLAAPVHSSPGLVLTGRENQENPAATQQFTQPAGSWDPAGTGSLPAVNDPWAAQQQAGDPWAAQPAPEPAPESWFQAPAASPAPAASSPLDAEPWPPPPWSPEPEQAPQQQSWIAQASAARPDPLSAPIAPPWANEPRPAQPPAPPAPQSYAEQPYAEQPYAEQPYADQSRPDPQYAQPQYAQPQYGEPQYGEPQYGEPQAFPAPQQQLPVQGRPFGDPPAQNPAFGAPQGQPFGAPPAQSGPPAQSPQFGEPQGQHHDAPQAQQQNPAYAAQQPAGHTGFDPESTAAWTLSEESQPISVMPSPAQPTPGPAAGSHPGPDSFSPPAQPQPQAQPQAQAPMNSWSQPAEPEGSASIVPDSWFAEARPRTTDDEGTAMWSAPPADPSTGELWGAQPGAQPWGAAPQDPWGAPPRDATAVMNGSGQGLAPTYPSAELPPGPGFGPAQGPQQGFQGGAYDQGPGFQQGAGFPPGQGFPPGPGAPGAEPERTGRSQASQSLIIAVGALVVAAIVVVAFTFMSGGGKTTTDHSTPASNNKPAKPPAVGGHNQAVAVNTVLDASGSSRNGLGRALNSAANCNGMATAITEMQQVQKDRQDQLNQVRGLKVDALQNGARLKTTLVKAISASLSVDEAFLTWAQANQTCKGKPKHDAGYRHGQQLSVQASRFKTQFADLWRPVAGKEGLPAKGPNAF